MRMPVMKSVGVRLYGFRDIEPQIFWRHDVISHVTIRLAVGGFL